MFKLLPIIISLSALLLAQSASDFKKQQLIDFKKEKLGFKVYKEELESEFKSYKQAQDKAYNNYKKEIAQRWVEPKMSTKTNWVAYTEDKNTRTDVDFENETIVIETIASSPKQAKKQLKLALAKVVTIDTKTVQENDPLEKILSKIKKPSSIIIGKVKSEPILSTVIFNKPPTKKTLVAYVNKKVKDTKIESRKSKKRKDYIVYSVNVKMPSNAMIKRSKLYYNEVKRQAKRQDIPVSLVFAIMHSESSFNPRARSHIPAYGLMQIVPSSAGIDTYQYLYNEKRLVSGSYLYNSKNNITMGSGYLHILYYKYLKKIKDPYSRLYCTIAAYNTGAGNIAWAFTRTNNMNKAAPIINSMSSNEVYNRLLKDLKYDEPKKYLKKVSKRMNAYNKIYG